MNSAMMLCLVLLGSYALSTLMLSGLVALVWRVVQRKGGLAAADLLTLRLLPAIGGALLVLAVALPAFLSQEPHLRREAAGPLLLILAAFSVLILGHGIWRAGRASAGAQALLRGCGPTRRWLVDNGQEIEVVDLPEPIVAVIGSWRPRVIAAESVVSACSTAELQQVIAHEAAHVFARDNLKQLLLIASPDPLAWTPVSSALIDRWRTVAELEADQRACGRDPCKRVALAGALIKVARAFRTAPSTRCALSMPIAADDVEVRVRQLLAAPSAPPHRRWLATAAALWLLPLPSVALPLYHRIYEIVEALVRIGL